MAYKSNIATFQVILALRVIYFIKKIMIIIILVLLVDLFPGEGKVFTA